jgi:hypothetical protein
MNRTECRGCSGPRYSSKIIWENTMQAWQYYYGSRPSVRDSEFIRFIHSDCLGCNRVSIDRIGVLLVLIYKLRIKCAR